MPPPFQMYKTAEVANERFSVGDTVSVKSGGKGTDFVAAIERIHTDKEGEVLIDARWYYRPEETDMGRQLWQGQDELLDSDHKDTFHVRCLNAKCAIYNLDDYEERVASGLVGAAQPYYCRSKYLKSKRALETPLPRYCACKLPQNPEYMLLQCDDCDEWFFGNCVGVSADTAGDMKKWTCPICNPDDGAASASAGAGAGAHRKRSADSASASASASASSSSFLDLVRRGECCPWNKTKTDAPPKKLKL